MSDRGGRKRAEAQCSVEHKLLIHSWILEGVKAVELVKRIADLGYTVSLPTAHRMIERGKLEPKADTAPPVPTKAQRVLEARESGIRAMMKRVIPVLEKHDNPKELQTWAMSVLDWITGTLESIAGDPAIPSSNRCKAIELLQSVATDILDLATVMEETR